MSLANTPARRIVRSPNVPSFFLNMSVLLTAWLSVGVQAASLSVASGETHWVKPSGASVSLDKLVLGDNAVVRFEPGVSSWNVYAKHAQIGQNVVIEASGASGERGADGVASKVSAKPCEAGAAGPAGDRGGNGRDAVDVKLSLGVSSIGSLLVRANGGAGGQGGVGASGQAAGEADRCVPGGGPGGAGGAGGRGGDGANIELNLWAVGTASIEQVRAMVSTESVGGEGGKGGEPGEGGAAQEGRYVNRKTLSGNRQWQEGGKVGTKGLPGIAGESGRNGQVSVSYKDDRQPIAVSHKPQEKKRTTSDARPIPVPPVDNNAILLRIERQLDLIDRKIDNIERRVQVLEHRR